MKRLYVAYGSNLNIRQMASRCPSASVYAQGTLDNWELLFRGSPVNSHATIRKRQGCHVPVLVWNIEPADEKRLDRYEGYPAYYYKKDIMVNIDGHKKKAMVYIMNERFRAGRPSSSYVETIVQGYMDNGFDQSYLNDVLWENYQECDR
ncbi:MAG: gamma-glutamylcyclotransferase [Clostridiales bacterium]|nr:gamma-glutamylcyclotransferase [Clostridiales bacterium]